MFGRDTRQHAAEIQIELYRRAKASQRVQIAIDLSDAARQTAIDGIRRRHPQYAERDVARTFLEMMYRHP